MGFSFRYYFFQRFLHELLDMYNRLKYTLPYFNKTRKPWHKLRYFFNALNQLKPNSKESSLVVQDILIRSRPRSNWTWRAGLGLCFTFSFSFRPQYNNTFLCQLFAFVDYRCIKNPQIRYFEPTERLCSVMKISVVFGELSWWPWKDYPTWQAVEVEGNDWFSHAILPRFARARVFPFPSPSDACRAGYGKTWRPT